MSSELLAPLVLLALIDSTSFGTLLIPLWLMLAPGRPRAGRILLFLSTVAAFYLMLGMVLLLGASMLVDSWQAIANSQPLQIAQLVVGLGLMALGIFMEPWTKAGKERRLARQAEKLAREGPSLQMRMRANASDPSAPVSAILALAITAVVIEAASMIPYLAAISLLTASKLTPVTRHVVLFGYCLLMIAPALLLLAARVLLHDYVAAMLKKLEAKLSRHANEAVAWVVFLLGAYFVGESWNVLGEI